MATYSFQTVNAALAGPGGSINLGYGAAVADEGVTISMAEDKNIMMVGADGEGMNSLRAAKHGTVHIRLLKTSPVNAQLMVLYDLQSLDATMWGQNVITITNTQSADITACRQCAFRKKPDMNYKKDGDILEWVFDAIKIDTVLGTY